MFLISFYDMTKCCHQTLTSWETKVKAPHSSNNFFSIPLQNKPSFQTHAKLNL